MDKRWYTIVEYVDVETGEIFGKKRFEKEDWVIINKVKYYEFKESHNERKYRYEVERSRQIRIEF